MIKNFLLDKYIWNLMQRMVETCILHLWLDSPHSCPRLIWSKYIWLLRLLLSTSWFSSGRSDGRVSLTLPVLIPILTYSCRWSIYRPPYFQLSETHKNKKVHLLGFSFLPDEYDHYNQKLSSLLENIIYYYYYNLVKRWILKVI